MQHNMGRSKIKKKREKRKFNKINFQYNFIKQKKLINRILLDIFALVHEFDRGKRKRV